ncbi:dihydroorotate dehydrogenase [Pyrobaculum islandicum DSM 4184]|uniref:Dihydroorotate dehydrogenase n=1 Tax=Pyrobaculum islandicum (strain DSM 4184 / JCM 9189 / GEO3) TaxID=384616 RepID=A1RRV3_PYRIL|nr:dihydroorotate dehydrogenase [Pyrobaculum islandicum]ABL87685.1 dihydroorotate dehydrogenase [Pyrobaculum islandicum DSM 4184]
MALLIIIGRLLHYVHPEISHRLGSLLFSLPLPTCRCVQQWEIGDVKVCGPVGVAAGLDKTGRYSRFLSFFCPGFIVVGSTLPYKRRGNKPPRVARIWPYSLVNAMGLNSPGIAAVLHKLTNLNYPIFISIAGFTKEDFLTQLIYLRRYKPTAVEVNISSPTYKGLWRDLPELIDIDMPMFIKVGPSVDVASVIRDVRRLGWGLVVTNTFPIEDNRISVGRGGLSGLLLYKYGFKLLVKVREAAGPDIPIIYSGGLFSCSQLREVLKYANAAEILTSILYFTPYILKILNRCLYSRE